MNFGSVLGGFLAVILGIFVIYRIIRAKLLRFSRRVFGTTDIAGMLKNADSVENLSPKSLNGCDTLLLPQILKDFPDFDVSQAKSYAREYLQQELNNRKSLTIHNIVISEYIRSATQKTIVFQAAVSCEENNSLQQLRYELRYAYKITAADETVAANCPNCGGALGYGVTVCPYCESRITNVLGNCWVFSDLNQC